LQNLEGKVQTFDHLHSVTGTVPMYPIHENSPT
jgi:hypothetical protein